MAETRELLIKNRLGLHARAAAMLVRLTNSFQAEVFIEKDGQRVNGKSIMGVMMLAAAKGTTIRVEVSGPDALGLLGELEQLVDNRFGESE